MGFEFRGKKIYVAGHSGMVGSALVRRLAQESCDILTTDRAAIDLRRQEAVETWMSATRPDAVFVAAAKVGGILANDTRPAEFLYDNLLIETNIIEAARRVGVEKLMFLGSSCVYPKYAEQPITEEALLSGPLEPTNQWYAVAKIAGLKLCEAYRRQYGCDFISVMPTNLYGPNDNFDLENSHVLPALLAKAHQAKLIRAEAIEVWGTGKPLREFLHVDDLADACIHLMKVYSDAGHINIGTGEDISIRDLAELICRVVGYEGALRFDALKPDGTPRKQLDISRLRQLGWNPSIDLPQGVSEVYRWYCDHIGHVRDAAQP